MSTSNDEYPMLVVDLLVDSVAKQIISLKGGRSKDVQKTAFRCLGEIGNFQQVIMPFDIKNTGATYQGPMTAIFYNLTGHKMDVYIDDVVVKTDQRSNHKADL